MSQSIIKSACNKSIRFTRWHIQTWPSKNSRMVLMAFLISFFPIAVSVGIGLSTLEPEYRDILRSLGASRVTIFRKIALPKTLPEFFGALKVSVTLAFIGTNLVEIVSPHGRGLGALFLSGQTNSDYPLMFAVLIALAAVASGHGMDEETALTLEVL